MSDFDRIRPFMWKPGQSGNPDGRPSQRALTRLLRKALEEPQPDGRTAAQVVAEALIQRAMKGSLGHVQEVFNRLEGRVPLQVQADGGGISLDVLVRAREIREARKTRNGQPESPAHSDESRASRIQP